MAKEQQAEMENLRLRLDQGNLVEFFSNLRKVGTLSNFEGIFSDTNNMDSRFKFLKNFVLGDFIQ